MSQVDAPARKSESTVRYRAVSGNPAISVALFLTALVLVGRAVASASSEQARSHIRDREVLYVTAPFRNTQRTDIYRVDFERGKMRGSVNLTHTTRQYECDPDVSPDGKWIAYAVMGDPKDGGSGIHVMAADGSHQRHLTPHGMIAFAPSWSPRGDRLVFSRVRWPKQGEPQGDLCLIDADGKNFTPLHAGWRPQWSPDGLHLLFNDLDMEGSIRLCVADIVGKETRNLRYLTEKMDFALHTPTGAWSPDGKRIAYTTVGKGAGLSTISVMNADGSGRRPLVRSKRTLDYAPQWSRDGRRVFFTRYGDPPDAQVGIWVVPVESATGHIPPARLLLPGTISTSNAVGVTVICFGGYGQPQQ